MFIKSLIFIKHFFPVRISCIENEISFVSLMHNILHGYQYATFFSRQYSSHSNNLHQSLLKKIFHLLEGRMKILFEIKVQFLSDIDSFLFAMANSPDQSAQIEIYLGTLLQACSVCAAWLGIKTLVLINVRLC